MADMKNRKHADEIAEERLRMNDYEKAPQKPRCLFFSAGCGIRTRDTTIVK